MTCRHLQCDRPHYARGVCYRHYDELLRPKRRDVRTVRLEELARAGLNRECVDCGDEPMFGGMRCHECFLTRVEGRRGGSEHLFPDKPPTQSTYSAGCRCWECRKASTEQRQRLRKAKG